MPQEPVPPPPLLSPEEFREVYNVSTKGSDWNILEEQQWSAYHRLESFRRLVAWSRGEGWRGYKNYIGTPILYPTFAARSFDRVVRSEAVQTQIQTLARKRAQYIMAQVHNDALSPTVLEELLQEPEVPWVPVLKSGKRAAPKSVRDLVPRTTSQGGTDLQRFYSYVHAKLEEELTRCAHDIMAKSAARMDSHRFIPMFGFPLNEMLVSMYHHGSHVKIEQVLELRRIAVEAQKNGQSIVFLPCHKSHIDYLVMSFILCRIGLTLPHIIAGDNLDLPVVGNMLRQGGALFVRRSFQGDALYSVVMKEYITSLIERALNIMVFIEGSRSRTGKLLMPRYGILKYMMGALRENRTSDILLCPVSLQYDSVLETETYISELLGKPKEPESLYNLVVGGSSLLQLKMGRLDIRFQKPWSMKEFLETESRERKLPQRMGNNDDRLLKALGFRVLSDINELSVIMPSALVGTVMLTLRGRGIGRAALMDGVYQLREMISRKGYEVASFGMGNIEAVVDRALGDMKGLIRERTELLERTYEPVKEFELSFYRNQIMHIFVHESLVCVSLYLYVKHGGAESDQVMSYEELYKACAFISGVLRDEFVYGPMSLVHNIQKSVEGLVRDGVLEIVPREGKSATVEQWMQGEGLLHLSDMERSLGRRSYDLYMFLVWPYIECYWLAAVTLLALWHDRPSDQPDDSVPWFNLKDLVPVAQKIGRTLVHQGFMRSDESVNGAALQNAFAQYTERGMIIKRKKGHRKPVTLVALHPAWTPSANPLGVSKVDAQPLEEYGRLAEFIVQLSEYRREGKSRRSQSDWRISAHIIAAAPKLVEWAPVGSGGVKL